MARRWVEHDGRKLVWNAPDLEFGNQEYFNRLAKLTVAKSQRDAFERVLNLLSNISRLADVRDLPYAARFYEQGEVAIEVYILGQLD